MVNPTLLVAIGAVPGAWLRFTLVKRLEPLLPHRHWGTFTVNMLACFGLGVLVAQAGPTGLVGSRSEPGPLGLLVGLGFLGSLSTFSTLVAELLETLRQGAWQESLRLASTSVAGGLVSMAAGRALGLTLAHLWGELS